MATNPYDTSDPRAKIQEAERRQAIIQAMLGRGPAVQPQHYGVGNVVADLASTFMQAKGFKNLEDTRAQANQDYTTGRRGAFDKYLQARGGYDPTNQETANPILEAILGLQPYGMEEFAQKDFERMTPQPRLADIDGRTFTQTPSGVSVTGDFRQRYKPPVKQGERLLQEAEGTGEIKAIGGGNASTIINMGERASEKQVATDFGKRLTEGREKAQAAFEQIRSLEPGVELLESGVKSGKFADLQLSFAKIGTALGFTDQEVANTETFIAEAGKRVAQIIKDFGAGTGLSDADREYATQIAAGKISVDEQTLLNVLNLARVASYNKLSEHNELTKRATSKPGYDDAELVYGLEIPSLDADDPYVQFNERTRRYTLRNPIKKGGPQKAKSARPAALSPAEQQRLQELRKKYRGGQ